MWFIIHDTATHHCNTLQYITTRYCNTSTTSINLARYWYRSTTRHCNTSLQHNAIHHYRRCNTSFRATLTSFYDTTLQYITATATHWYRSTTRHCNTSLQHIDIVLLHGTATHQSCLSWVMCCSAGCVLMYRIERYQCRAMFMCCSCVWRFIAICCSDVLQCRVVMYCNVLQWCVAVPCSDV